MAKAHDQCEVSRPHASKPAIIWQCRKRSDHVLKAGKYDRKHMDTKASPPFYWDATDEEIANYQARITNDRINGSDDTINA